MLLSAHLDHLGIGTAVNGDDIYNGADDDASGVTAVLEFARTLGSGPKPKRTVIFALFGSEETGRFGARYFLRNPPLPLKQIVVNLEFEMLGRADPAAPPGTVWLTDGSDPIWVQCWLSTARTWLAIPIGSRISLPAPTTTRWRSKA